MSVPVCGAKNAAYTSSEAKISIQTRRQLPASLTNRHTRKKYTVDNPDCSVAVSTAKKVNYQQTVRFLSWTGWIVHFQVKPDNRSKDSAQLDSSIKTSILSIV
jgi:hypothetical protein